MRDYLSSNIIIENVIQFKMRGRVAYQGIISSHVAITFSYSKPYNDPSGKGYQRPINKKRSNDFATYLSQGEDSLYTPILLNAAGNWEFHAYSKERPSYGRLVAKKKASLMDGQHRLAGIEEYCKSSHYPIHFFHIISSHCLTNSYTISYFS